MIDRFLCGRTQLGTQYHIMFADSGVKYYYLFGQLKPVSSFRVETIFYLLWYPSTINAL